MFLRQAGLEDSAMDQLL